MVIINLLKYDIIKSLLAFIKTLGLARYIDCCFSNGLHLPAPSTETEFKAVFHQFGKHLI